MFETKKISDVVQIAAAGGGFTFNATNRLASDLIKISAAAAEGGARITFTGLAMRKQSDLVKIAGAGKGHITFAE